MARTSVYCIAEIISSNPLHYRHFKIGVAGNPHSRLSTFRTGNPHHLSILLAYWYASADDAHAVERAAHKYLENQAVRGEWFKFGDACPFEALSLAEGVLPYRGETDTYVGYVEPHYHPSLLKSPVEAGRLQ